METTSESQSGTSKEFLSLNSKENKEIDQEMNKLHRTHISKMEEIAKFYEGIEKPKKSHLTKFDIAQYIDLEHPAEIKLVYYIFSQYYIKFARFSLTEEEIKKFIHKLIKNGLYSYTNMRKALFLLKSIYFYTGKKLKSTQDYLVSAVIEEIKPRSCEELRGLLIFITALTLEMNFREHSEHLTQFKEAVKTIKEYPSYIINYYQGQCINSIARAISGGSTASLAVNPMITFSMIENLATTGSEDEFHDRYYRFLANEKHLEYESDFNCEPLFLLTNSSRSSGSLMDFKGSYNYEFYQDFLKLEKWIEKANVLDKITFSLISEDNIEVKDLEYICKILSLCLHTSNLKLLYKTLKLVLSFMIKFEAEFKPFLFQMCEQISKAMIYVNPQIQKLVEQVLFIMGEKVFNQPEYICFLILAIQRTNNSRVLTSLGHKIIHNSINHPLKISYYSEILGFFTVLKKFINTKDYKVKETGAMIIIQLIQGDNDAEDRECEEEEELQLEDIPEAKEIYNYYMDFSNTAKLDVYDEKLNKIIESLPDEEEKLGELSRKTVNIEEEFEVVEEDQPVQDPTEDEEKNSSEDEEYDLCDEFC
ncbi:unnamed protein product [Moneuplotes crassus]|uniref:Uncharacterized protein n=1 Tax=Euplotes crassus TaxID=5936 RepID=A0AAD1Y9X1_EUPCR|nr:unnamed protein product [Moneuplotes crassus]